MWKDPTRRKEYDREWRKKNPHKVVARYKKWVEGHRDVLKARHNRKRNENKQLVEGIKLARGCADCGYKAHPAALDFDHLQVKRFNLAHHGLHSTESILAEIAKCEVVCANCHRIRTYNRRQVKGN